MSKHIITNWLWLSSPQLNEGSENDLHHAQRRTFIVCVQNSSKQNKNQNFTCSCQPNATRIIQNQTSGHHSTEPVSSLFLNFLYRVFSLLPVLSACGISTGDINHVITDGRNCRAGSPLVGLHSRRLRNNGDLIVNLDRLQQ